MLKQDPSQQNNSDYQYIKRSEDTSIKYKFTLAGKTIHTLDPNSPSDSIKNIPIVCSYADMDFKLAPDVHKEFLKLMAEENTCLGYCLPGTQLQTLITKRMQERFSKKIQQDHIDIYSSMLGLYYAIIEQLTSQGDNVLIFTPTYYRFLFTIKDMKRNAVQYELKERITQQGKQFYIDFQELEQIFKKNRIKLVVWASPHNPTGRIWNRQQCSQLKDLLVKYKSLVFSDDIYCEAIPDPFKKHCCLYQFQDLHSQLIWASSIGKAFNCSGNSFAYAFIPSQQIRDKLFKTKLAIPLFALYTAYMLCKSCFNVGQQWRQNTITYINQNYRIFKEECQKRNLKVEFFTLESSYLVGVDFKAYGLKHSQIVSRLESQNVFPTYLTPCYVNKNPEDISIVRFNIALNRKVLQEMIQRLERVFSIKQK